MLGDEEQRRGNDGRRRADVEGVMGVTPRSNNITLKETMSGE
jgi:hypothetical protein